ncbi:MAG: bifunctional diaminohydroxyphosphoribosylaminopyrimidine deaminase/5-amino-6-(5-phosphoribosylamino)uracil reductase RibD [Hyphomicrobiales bacterium]|nr:bifunctional diaminohydroxyphosphoribosylaminopyrimidine deaminase/5-amino-6-(5-phosphoribosylamino)uracil reductase RibD [Hyphomicrobiales bacterium]
MPRMTPHETAGSSQSNGHDALTAGASFERLALSLAKRGLGQTWPNPSVGAAIVSSDGREIVGEGFTGQGGRPHAEAIALAAAGERARGASMYVTLEPCAHHGMTPPCSDAIVAAGVTRVVYGVVDPDPRVSGAGLARLEANGVSVRQGAFSDEAAWINLGHTLRITHGRPFVQLKLAVGCDGKVPAGDGAPVWVTCEASREYAHRLRAEADAIAVGSGTIAADDPQLTCRLPGLFHRSPVRVVFSSRADVPTSARLFRDIESVPVWIVAGAEAARGASALRKAGAMVIEAPAPGGRLAIGPSLEALAGHGLTRLFVEGGPALAGAFLDAGLVDELFIFKAAKAAGPAGLAPFGGAGLERLDALPQFRLVGERRVEGDVILTYRRSLSDILAQKTGTGG